jgi:hypothetical protein
MEGPLQAWVRPMLHQPQVSSLSPRTVDLGGSLAVASRGLYATGVSTDLNGKLTFVQTIISSDQYYLQSPSEV